MKISIIVPTYKPQSYIWESLHSIVAQSFPREEFEVIIVLNGCCSPWREEIEDFIATHMQGLNVRFIQTDEGGVSNARNIALDNASGEYVTFLDDDDYISPRYLEELYTKASPDTVSVCYPYAFNDGHAEIQLQNYGLNHVYEHFHHQTHNSISSAARRYFSGPCMKLISKDIILDRRFDKRFKNGEDSIYMFLISDKIKNIVFTSKEAVYYRRYRENSAVMQTRKRGDRIRNNINCIIEYTKIYFSGHYNTLFYFSRIAAELRCICYAILKR